MRRRVLDCLTKCFGLDMHSMPIPGAVIDELMLSQLLAEGGT